MTHTMKREGIYALVGAGFAVAAVIASVLTLVWLSAFPYLVAATRVSLMIATVTAVAMAGICLYHWRGWRRDDPSSAYIMSWRLHWASYPLMLIGACAYALAISTFEAGTVGFWLSLGAALFTLAAQAVGAVQYVRCGGAPGTVGAHLRNWIARRNAREDARLPLDDDRDGSVVH